MPLWGKILAGGNSLTLAVVEGGNRLDEPDGEFSDVTILGNQTRSLRNQFP